MTRKEEREQAFILIFEKSFNDTDPDDIIADARESLGWEESQYVDKTFKGTFENLEDIDEKISRKLSNGWSLQRLSRVTLSLLRLAVFEMYYNDDVPESVAINEAVELCRKYASESDVTYLNGVLGAISRSEDSEK